MGHSVELRHLRYFVAVASARTFIRAAEQLHVSQPALSQQIRDLEDYIGVPLLQRHPRGVSLTQAGEALLPLAQRLLDDARAAVSATRSASNTLTGTICVGLPETDAAVRVARDLIAALAHAFPSASFVTTGLPWLENPGALLRQTIDLGFAWSGGPPHRPRYPRGVSWQRLLDDPGEYALIGRDHPLARARSVTIEQLSASKFALFDRHLHPEFFDHLVAELRWNGVRFLDIANGVGSASASVPLVTASGGWTIVSRLVSKEPLPGAVTKRIRGVSVDAGLDVIWRTADSRPHIRELPTLISQLGISGALARDGMKEKV